jgi:hypothetical protein
MEQELTPEEFMYELRDLVAAPERVRLKWLARFDRDMAKRFPKNKEKQKPRFTVISGGRQSLPRN